MRHVGGLAPPLGALLAESEGGSNEMSVYYCHRCAAINDIMNAASPANLIGTEYQLEKFIKHTAPTGTYPVNSIFHDPAYSVYSTYVVSTTGSGCFEVDDLGRRNMIWIAGRDIGATFRNGVLVAPSDAVKVVWHDNVWKIHAFPTLSDQIETKRCVMCGDLVAY